MGGRFRYDRIPAGSAVLCALSGGADSMYLLSRLLEGAPAGGYTVRAAHYDHGLRPSSGAEAEFVRRWCERLGVPLTVGRGDVAAEAARRHTGIEETARDLRYAFLRRTAADTGCTLIATGHHAGDNAETVLMNLIRGCGLAGLAGIPAERDGLIRPMLTVTREEIRAYLAAHAIPHVEDESNGDPAYTRNRVRGELLPLLTELNPRAEEHINALSRRAAEDEELLTAMAEELLARCGYAPGGDSLCLTPMCGAPRPIALRALRVFLPGARAVHLEAVLALCHVDSPSAAADIPGARVCRDYDRLLRLPGDTERHPPLPLAEGLTRWNGWVITCAPAVCPQKAYVSREEFHLRPGRYLIRPRREGDRLQLGRRPCKTLKALMIEQRVPKYLRDTVPVLAEDGGTAAAAGGLGPHWESLARPNEPCLHITIKKENEPCIHTLKRSCSPKRN